MSLVWKDVVATPRSVVVRLDDEAVLIQYNPFRTDVCYYLRSRLIGEIVLNDCFRHQLQLPP